MDDSEVQPDEFALFQNFPNPFNPSTTITYQLLVSSDVKLNVYDVFGREVATLVAARQSAGRHEVKFDADGLSSGFYFYKLVAGIFVAIQEMLLIK